MMKDGGVDALDDLGVGRESIVARVRAGDDNDESSDVDHQADNSENDGDAEEDPDGIDGDGDGDGDGDFDGGGEPSRRRDLLASLGAASASAVIAARLRRRSSHSSSGSKKGSLKTPRRRTSFVTVNGAELTSSSLGQASVPTFGAAAHASSETTPNNDQQPMLRLIDNLLTSRRKRDSLQTVTSDTSSAISLFLDSPSGDAFRGNGIKIAVGIRPDANSPLPPSSLDSSRIGGATDQRRSIDNRHATNKGASTSNSPKRAADGAFVDPDGVIHPDYSKYGFLYDQETHSYTDIQQFEEPQPQHELEPKSSDSRRFARRYHSDFKAIHSRPTDEQHSENGENSDGGHAAASNGHRQQQSQHHIGFSKTDPVSRAVVAVDRRRLFQLKRLQERDVQESLGRDSLFFQPVTTLPSSSSVSSSATTGHVSSSTRTRLSRPPPSRPTTTSISTSTRSDATNVTTFASALPASSKTTALTRSSSTASSLSSKISSHSSATTSFEPTAPLSFPRRPTKVNVGPPPPPPVTTSSLATSLLPQPQRRTPPAKFQLNPQLQSVNDGLLQQLNEIHDQTVNKNKVAQRLQSKRARAASTTATHLHNLARVTATAAATVTAATVAAVAALSPLPSAPLSPSNTTKSFQDWESFERAEASHVPDSPPREEGDSHLIEQTGLNFFPRPHLELYKCEIAANMLKMAAVLKLRPGTPLGRGNELLSRHTVHDDETLLLNDEFDYSHCVDAELAAQAQSQIKKDDAKGMDKLVNSMERALLHDTVDALATMEHTSLVRELSEVTDPAMLEAVRRQMEMRPSERRAWQQELLMPAPEEDDQDEQEDPDKTGSGSDEDLTSAATASPRSSRSTAARSSPSGRTALSVRRRASRRGLSLQSNNHAVETEAAPSMKTGTSANEDTGGGDGTAVPPRSGSPRSSLVRRGSKGIVINLHQEHGAGVASSPRSSSHSNSPSPSAASRVLLQRRASVAGALAAAGAAAIAVAASAGVTTVATSAVSSPASDLRRSGSRGSSSPVATTSGAIASSLGGFSGVARSSFRRPSPSPRGSVHGGVGGGDQRRLSFQLTQPESSSRRGIGVPDQRDTAEHNRGTISELMYNEQTKEDDGDDGDEQIGEALDAEVSDKHPERQNGSSATGARFPVLKVTISGTSDVDVAAPGGDSSGHGGSTSVSSPYHYPQAPPPSSSATVAATRQRSRSLLVDPVMKKHSERGARGEFDLDDGWTDQQQLRQLDHIRSMETAMIIAAPDKLDDMETVNDNDDDNDNDETREDHNEKENEQLDARSRVGRIGRFAGGNQKESKRSVPTEPKIKMRASKKKEKKPEVNITKLKKMEKTATALQSPTKKTKKKAAADGTANKKSPDKPKPKQTSVKSAPKAGNEDTKISGDQVRDAVLIRSDSASSFTSFQMDGDDEDRHSVTGSDTQESSVGDHSDSFFDIRTDADTAGASDTTDGEAGFSEVEVTSVKSGPSSRPRSGASSRGGGAGSGGRSRRESDTASSVDGAYSHSDELQVDDDDGFLAYLSATPATAMVSSHRSYSSDLAPLGAPTTATATTTLPPVTPGLGSSTFALRSVGSEEELPQPGMSVTFSTKTNPDLSGWLSRAPPTIALSAAATRSLASPLTSPSLSSPVSSSWLASANTLVSAVHRVPVPLGGNGAITSTPPSSSSSRFLPRALAAFSSSSSFSDSVVMDIGPGDSARTTKSVFDRNVDDDNDDRFMTLFRREAAADESRRQREAIRRQAELERNRSQLEQVQATLLSKLNKIWSVLETPTADKLQLINKYVNADYATRLNAVLTLYEQVAALIADRERWLAMAKYFEVDASDPRRLFEGLSVARLSEAKGRFKIVRELEGLRPKIEALCLTLKTQFNELVKFNGEEYTQKMKFDYSAQLKKIEQQRQEAVSDPSLSSLLLPERLSRPLFGHTNLRPTSWPRSAATTTTMLLTTADNSKHGDGGTMVVPPLLGVSDSAFPVSAAINASLHTRSSPVAGEFVRPVTAELNYSVEVLLDAREVALQTELLSDLEKQLVAATTVDYIDRPTTSGNAATPPDGSPTPTLPHAPLGNTTSSMTMTSSSVPPLHFQSSSSSSSARVRTSPRDVTLASPPRSSTSPPHSTAQRSTSSSRPHDADTASCRSPQHRFSSSGADFRFSQTQPMTTVADARHPLAHVLSQFATVSLQRPSTSPAVAISPRHQYQQQQPHQPGRNRDKSVVTASDSTVPRKHKHKHTHNRNQHRLRIELMKQQQSQSHPQPQPPPQVNVTLHSPSDSRPLSAPASIDQIGPPSLPPSVGAVRGSNRPVRQFRPVVATVRYSGSARSASSASPVDTIGPEQLQLAAPVLLPSLPSTFGQYQLPSPIPPSSQTAVRIAELEAADAVAVVTSSGPPTIVATASGTITTMHNDAGRPAAASPNHPLSARQISASNPAVVPGKTVSRVYRTRRLVGSKFRSVAAGHQASLSARPDEPVPPRHRAAAASIRYPELGAANRRRAAQRDARSLAEMNRQVNEYTRRLRRSANPELTHTATTAAVSSGSLDGSAAEGRSTTLTTIPVTVDPSAAVGAAVAAAAAAVLRRNKALPRNHVPSSPPGVSERLSVPAALPAGFSSLPVDNDLLNASADEDADDLSRYSQEQQRRRSSVRSTLSGATDDGFVMSVGVAVDVKLGGRTVASDRTPTPPIQFEPDIGAWGWRKPTDGTDGHTGDGFLTSTRSASRASGHEDGGEEDEEEEESRDFDDDDDVQFDDDQQSNHDD